ncbi:MAG TPA: TadE/TadG family type IV pilus assembly protein [Arachnia sp.]|nr:TadE/TadG family type IV pilus assembly protein [Arachnia sp.]HMT84886.1 TadE/TadG family type IV pilus assembly protein [Arachnia sp.]
MIRRDERGLSLAVWTTLTMPAFVLAVGLGVDFAGHATAEQDCRAVAREAARSAGQQVAVSLDGTPILNVSTARTAALSRLQADGYSGSVQIDDHTITVTAEGEYRTLFLGMIGVETLAVDGVGTAEVARTFEGAPR